MERPIEYGRFEDGSSVNYWEMEPALARAFGHAYRTDAFERAEASLRSFGQTVGHRIAPNAEIIDDNGPELSTYDRKGNLVNDVTKHPAQVENERLAVESGLIHDALRETSEGQPLGPIHALGMQTLASYADVGLVCAISMTAGVALVLEHHDQSDDFEKLYEELTAQHAENSSQGAMFLTEQHAGSDVGAIETSAEQIAEPQAGLPAERTYALNGEKWFCSNIDAQGTLTLARRPGAPEGTDGLSLFWVPHMLPGGGLNQQVYRRLKDKLGTESVATGEVVFDGTVGVLLGTPERGFRAMTTMLNWERVTNATGAAGVLGRALLESKIHTANRHAFGHRLDAHPLMRRDLVDMQVDFEAALVVATEAGRWFDRHHRNPQDEQALARMRGLVPVAKYRTGRMAVEWTAYAMEIRGGEGYVADFVHERLLRDAQVLPIWEGASNVLALDFLRAVQRVDAGAALLALIDELLQPVRHPHLEVALEAVRTEQDSLEAMLSGMQTADRGDAEHRAKELADHAFDVVAASRLLAAAERRLDAHGDLRTAAVAGWFVRERLENGPDAISDTAVDDELFDAVLRYAQLDPSDRKAV